MPRRLRKMNPVLNRRACRRMRCCSRPPIGHVPGCSAHAAVGTGESVIETGLAGRCFLERITRGRVGILRLPPF